MSHEYSVGETVVVKRWKGGHAHSSPYRLTDHGFEDTIIRASAHFVSTAEHGSFRTSSERAGFLEKAVSGYESWLRLLPLDHPEVLRDREEDKAHARRNGRENARIAKPLAEWTIKGTPETLAAAIAELEAAQARYGEAS